MLGISIFTLGDVDGFPDFNPVGVILISIALSLDAFCSNFEERNFFDPRRNPEPASQAEVLCFASLFGSFFSVVTMSISGEMLPALQLVNEVPRVVPLTCLVRAQSELYLQK